MIGRTMFVLLTIGTTLLFFPVWPFGVLLLSLSLGPCVGFCFVLKDNSSVNRKFFYRLFKVSMLAFFVTLMAGLVTLEGSLKRFCTRIAERQPQADTWT